MDKAEKLFEKLAISGKLITKVVNSAKAGGRSAKEIQKKRMGMERSVMKGYTDKSTGKIKEVSKSRSKVLTDQGNALDKLQ